MYPITSKKHLEEALFHPLDYLRHTKQHGEMEDFPKKAIITFHSSVERYLRRKYKLKKSRFFSSANLYHFSKDLVILKSNGIGAPHATALVEELIALGVEQLIIVGTAGGLQDYGIHLCSKAQRDEGTSYHYQGHGRYAHPDKNLTQDLKRYFKHNGIDFTYAPSWTIDAPYRETKKEIINHKKEGIATVEMEASALFALGHFRNIQVAAVFAVSDLVVVEGWEPQLKTKKTAKILNTCVDSVVDFLSD